MARHRVKVLEGGEVRETLVPFATVYEYPDAHDGATYDMASTGDWVVFASWVAWHAFTHRGDEERPFEAFVQSVEWVTIEDAADELDPSGGESTPTSSSPASSQRRRSASSSSGTPSGSKKRSGASSKG